MNTFSLDEEQSDSHYSRKVKFSFTDISIDKVASVLGGHVPLTPIVNTQRAVIREQQPFLSSSQKQLEETQDNQNEELIEESINHSSQKTSDANDPLNYFEKDGQGILISTNPDYKGKNKKLQQQRFSLLYVWAYKLLHQEPVPSKEHLNEAAKTNGVHDKNYSTHLNDVANRFFIKSDGTFKINPSGNTEIHKIIAEMQNSDIVGYEYSKQARKNTSRSSRTTKEEIHKIEEWIQISSSFENFEIRSLETAVNFAILAIFEITKELKVQESVKPGLAYEYLIKKYQTVSVKKDTFTKALTNTKDYSKYFGRTHEGSYYLTTEAENVAKEWLEQGSFQKP